MPDMPLRELPENQTFSWQDALKGRTIKGRIVNYLTVWCGLCERFLCVEAKTRARAAVEAKSAGWVLTKTRGWLCPECAKEAADATR